MNDNLDNLLEELRSRGVLDSTDAFGVDVIRGESKLGRFQLANPGHYLLKILQAAVVNGLGTNLNNKFTSINTSLK